MIEGKPFGIIYSIHDEILTPQSSDERLMKNIIKNNKDNCLIKQDLKDKSIFLLSHYSKQTAYNITGFVKKNQDQLSKNLRLAMQESELEVV